MVASRGLSNALRPVGESIGFGIEVKMTIRNRLLAGMVTIGVLFLVPLIGGVLILDRMRDQVTQMRDREFAASVLLARVRSNVDVLRRTESAFALRPTQSSASDVDTQARKLFAMGSLLDSYGLSPAADSLRAAVQEVEQHVPKMLASSAPLAPSAATNPLYESNLATAANRADRAIGAAERSLRESTDSRVAQVAGAMQRGEWMLVLTLIAAGVITVIVALRLSDFVDRPLKALERGMAEVAGGEFEQKLGIPATRVDEFGRLASAFTSMATRLKDLEQMRASWLADVTHELKNEVGPIIGYMDLLIVGDVYEPLAAKPLEKCMRTKVLAERMRAHLLKFLAVNALESGSRRLTLSRFDLGDFLNEIESDFGAMARSRNVGFTVTRPASYSRWVTWDRESMREVLENLLSNAFKFTPAAGAVSVTAEESDYGVRLSVTDSGAGIPPEDVEKIFGKYFKAKNQAKSSEKGTGLGLAIVREIVYAHEGSIQCASTVGSGTTFTLTMPIDCTVETTDATNGTAPEHSLEAEGALTAS
jgi:signal transduction histidine kinase